MAYSNTNAENIGVPHRHTSWSYTLLRYYSFRSPRYSIFNRLVHYAPGE